MITDIAEVREGTDTDDALSKLSFHLTNSTDE